MKRTVIIFVNGIMNFPGDSHGWNYRAVVWTHLSGSPMEPIPVEYFCGPIGRAFGQKKRAQKICELLEAYAGWNIILVGHSNGCAVILKALGMALVYPRIQAIHLVSGACEADFNRNGLNEAVEGGKVGKVCVYVAGKDMALRVASHWMGRLLGYGVLGLHGMQNVPASLLDRIGQITQEDFGHSSWWEAEHFDRSMGHFTQ